MKTVKTAAYWRKTYRMEPHPEGGYYKEIHRAELTMETPWGRKRNASTGIVYLLENENKSKFHKIKSDELWHLYDASSTVLIHTLNQSGNYELLKLGYESGELPCAIVPAGVWFAAELGEKKNTFALCGCTVSPGFDFADFEMARKDDLMNKYPNFRQLINSLS